LTNEIRGFESHKKWVDWVSQFRDRFDELNSFTPEEKKDFLVGILEKIGVKTIDSQTHELDLTFKIPVVDDEIDLESQMWTIPGEKSKNGFPHRVPLSEQALTLLEDIKENSGESQWLFPSPGHPEKHVISTSVDHALRKNQNVFEFPLFTPYDTERDRSSFRNIFRIYPISNHRQGRLKMALHNDR